MPHKPKSPFLERVLYRTNLFKNPLQLTIDGKLKLSTLFGGILTLMVISIILVQAVNQFNSMVNKENPQIYQINEIEDNPAFVQLSQENNFFLAITFSKEGIVLDLSTASPFSFKTSYAQYIRTEGAAKAVYKNSVFWAPCNRSDFSDHLYAKNMFQLYSLNHAYCISAMGLHKPYRWHMPQRYQSQVSQLYRTSEAQYARHLLHPTL